MELLPKLDLNLHLDLHGLHLQWLVTAAAAAAASHFHVHNHPIGWGTPELTLKPQRSDPLISDTISGKVTRGEHCCHKESVSNLVEGARHLRTFKCRCIILPVYCPRRANLMTKRTKSCLSASRSESGSAPGAAAKSGYGSASRSAWTSSAMACHRCRRRCR